MEWLEENKIPIGQWLSDALDFLILHLGWLFDGIDLVLNVIFDATTDVMLATPWFLFIAIIAGVAWYVRRSWKLVAFVIFAQLMMINLGYWEATMETLALVIWATVLCMIMGVPIGIAAAHRPKLWLAMRPVLDMMQTVPVFVYLIPALAMFGLGATPGLMATIIFVLPAPIRLSYLGVSSTPKNLLEAAESFGATKSQLLWKVEIPYAMPSIMAGLTQTIMLTLSMVVIASMVAAPGLGVDILRSINQVNAPKGFEAGLVIALVAIIMERICRKPGSKEE
ncbi:choline ABC transporter permease subunit [Aestuariispira insulae]|uniref:Glycine betaine/proline transport system permease protein n=1 Tax=Aestuariispira insulae TaxID=1461337 RepID=A0A3D9HJX2_9PROT|nr:choline ABC transporter permease subunit [Aestuariispira insulae]RED49812.1 glycine betaine/proline transport system permease protein [Aestuariispira insulae]